MIAGRLPGSDCEVTVRTVNFIKEKFEKKKKKNIKKNQTSTNKIKIKN